MLKNKQPTFRKRHFLFQLIPSSQECYRADSKHNYEVTPSGNFYKVSLLTFKCYGIIFRRATLGSRRVQTFSYKISKYVLGM